MALSFSERRGYQKECIDLIARAGTAGFAEKRKIQKRLIEVIAILRGESVPSGGRDWIGELRAGRHDGDGVADFEAALLGAAGQLGIGQDDAPGELRDHAVRWAEAFAKREGAAA